VERPNRDPEKDERPKLDPPKCELKPVPPRHEAPAPEAVLEGPQLCQPLPTPPPLRAEKPEAAKLLRPPAEREEPPAFPKECHCPSFIAERLVPERKFDERFPNEAELRPD